MGLEIETPLALARWYPAFYGKLIHVVHNIALNPFIAIYFENQRTNGPVNAHLTPWPSKAQNIQNLENIW